MSDRSFVRTGGLAGILLALTSWASVAAYYALVPPAQQVPLTGTRDANAYLASLATNTTGLVVFNGLYAAIAFFALVATIASYQRLRVYGEAWAFFATLVGTFASGATIISSFADLARVRYLGESANLVALGEPSAVNPVGVTTFGLTAIWFAVAAVLLWRGRFPRLLAVLAGIAFADLVAGFVASLIGVTTIATVAAIVAGAVGGPIFWLWLGILLWRDAGAVPA